MAPERQPHGVTRHDTMRIPVDSISEEHVAEAVWELVERPGVSQIMLLRWWDFMRARRDREYRSCVRESVLAVPVSRSIVLATQVLRKARPQRFMPFDLVIRILGALEEKGKSAYILGGTHGALRVVEQNLRETYPGLRFVGRYTGFYRREHEADIITAIRKADPDFVLVGPGVPGADRWIVRHRKDLPSGIYLSAPEAFDIFSERRQRVSHKTFNRGLDFIPGLLRRPWRLFRFLVYLWFLFMLLIFRVFRL